MARRKRQYGSGCLLRRKGGWALRWRGDRNRSRWRTEASAPLRITRGYVAEAGQCHPRAAGRGGEHEDDHGALDGDVPGAGGPVADDGVADVQALDAEEPRSHPTEAPDAPIRRSSPTRDRGCPARLRPRISCATRRTCRRTWRTSRHEASGLRVPAHHRRDGARHARPEGRQCPATVLTTRTSNVRSILADVNVWLAPLVAEHPHHDAATRWWREDVLPASENVAFCRLTQLGLLRLLSSKRVMGRSPSGPRTRVGRLYRACCSGECHRPR